MVPPLPFPLTFVSVELLLLLLRVGDPISVLRIRWLSDLEIMSVMNVA